VARTVALVALLLFLGTIAYVTLQEECTVGVTGTAATLTVRGFSARSICDQWQRTSTIATYALSQGALTTPVICQYVIARPFGIATTATVRDEGSLKIVGNSICEAVRKIAVAYR
jgi:hypothetical protein